MALLSKAPTPNVAISTTGMLLLLELALMPLAHGILMSQALSALLAGDYQVLQVMALPLQVMALASKRLVAAAGTHYFGTRCPVSNDG